ETAARSPPACPGAQPTTRSGSHDGVIHLASCVEQAGGDVLGLEVGVVRQDLLGGFPSGEKLEHVDDADAHPPDAWAPPALLRVDRDASQELGLVHGTSSAGGPDRTPEDSPSAASTAKSRMG